MKINPSIYLQIYFSLSYFLSKYVNKTVPIHTVMYIYILYKKLNKYSNVVLCDIKYVLKIFLGKQFGPCLLLPTYLSSTIYLSVYLSTCLSVCLSASYLSIQKSIYLLSFPFCAGSGCSSIRGFLGSILGSILTVGRRGSLSRVYRFQGLLDRRLPRFSFIILSGTFPSL